jgi:hypothetical protein
VKVIRHQDEGVKSDSSFLAILGENVDEEQSRRLDLEEPTAICGDGGDEEGTKILWS